MPAPIDLHPSARPLFAIGSPDDACGFRPRPTESNPHPADPKSTDGDSLIHMLDTHNPMSDGVYVTVREGAVNPKAHPFSFGRHDSPTTTAVLHEEFVESKFARNQEPARTRARKAPLAAKGRHQGIQAKLNANQKLSSDDGTKRGATKLRSAKTKMDALRYWLSIGLAAFITTGSFPVMITLKYVGSAKNWLAVAPDDASTTRHLLRLQDFFLRDFGYEMSFFWFKDFGTTSRAPHFHVFLSPPTTSSQGMTFPNWLEQNWGAASDQASQFSQQTQQGLLSWVPSLRMTPRYETVEKAYRAFARYESSKFDDMSGKYVPKVASKRVAPQWLTTGNYRVAWFGASRNLQPKAPAMTATFRCDCGTADFHSLMQTQGAAQREMVLVPSRIVPGATVTIDRGRWSLDILDRGSTEFMKSTNDLIAAVLEIEKVHTDCSPLLPPSALRALLDAVEPKPAAASVVPFEGKC